MPNNRSTRDRHDGQRAPTVIALDRDANGTDFDSILDDTTLLVLGTDTGCLRDYRIWAEEFGGIALSIGSEYALADWLDRHHFTRAAVLIDDTSLDTREAMRIAAEIRLLRPDVAVTVLVGPRIDPTGPPQGQGHAAHRPLPQPARDGPGYAVFYRPLGRSGFARALASARRHVIVDRETRHHIGGRPQPVPTPTDDVYWEEVGPRSGLWIGPLIILGAALWTGIAILAL